MIHVIVASVCCLNGYLIMWLFRNCLYSPGEKRSVQEQDCPDDNSVPCYPNNGPFPCQDALKEGQEPPLNVLQGQWAHLGEQDSDEEPGDDTDDTSSVTSSASSTASLQSGPTRKKSIPLSIRNLKRKHKKKRTKFSREFKPGDRWKYPQTFYWFLSSKLKSRPAVLCCVS